MERAGREGSDGLGCLEGVQFPGWLEAGSCVRNSRSKGFGTGLEASKDP